MNGYVDYPEQEVTFRRCHLELTRLDHLNCHKVELGHSYAQPSL
jgi:hypothetical protein